MRQSKLPILDPRDAQSVLKELLDRRPGYLPTWQPAQGSGSWAMLHIFARMMQTVIGRLNQAPDKNMLAFLDMLGISLVPAQAARAPVVFQVMPNSGDGRAPAGTRLGAKPQEPDGEPVTFETEQAIGLASAQLAELVSLWPGRDAYADHSAALVGGQPFTLFEPLSPVPHALYLAHDTLFAFSGQAQLDIEFELSPGQPVRALSIVWEYWDGDVWRPFNPSAKGGHTADHDGTAGLTRSGVIRLATDCGRAVKTKVNGIEAFWVRGRLDQPLPPAMGNELPGIDRIRMRTVIERKIKRDESGALDCASDDLQPDQAFTDGFQLDVSKTFYPFGQHPRPGSAFYFSNEEVFGKPGAEMVVCIQVLSPPEPGSDLSPPEPGPDLPSPEPDPNAERLPLPEITWEYWNGRRWGDLTIEVIDPSPPPSADQDPTCFNGDGVFRLEVRSDMAPVEVNNQEGLWMRARLKSGAYGFKREITWTDPSGNVQVTPIIETVPPALEHMHLGYIYRSPWEGPVHCLTYNDFQFQDHSQDARWAGTRFTPFRPVADRTPALYLGFDRPLPSDLVSLYFDIVEDEGRRPGPALVWEAWDGLAWRELAAMDETAHLSRPGMLSFIGQRLALARLETSVVRTSGTQVQVVEARKAARFQVGDLVFVQKDGAGQLATVAQVRGNLIELMTPLEEDYTGGQMSLADLPRFGIPRAWVRARLKEDGDPVASPMTGLHLNAVWAAQRQTLSDEVLASSSGQPNQVFFFRQIPVLPGEHIEVRELSGPRAQVELPILTGELLKAGLTEEDIRTVSDPRTDRVTEVWVRWQARPHLYFSGPDDRHYVIERARGRLMFGDDRLGKIPPPGDNNILARRYQAGGGLAGNVPAGAVSQLLGMATPAQAVSNPRPAEGGADGETMDALRWRGPQTIRHRWRPLSARDYEALAREASPGVAVARALPTTHFSGRYAPGWVSLAIIPHSPEPQPMPSLELKRRVQRYLSARAPAGVAGIHVTGPHYLPIGVALTVAPRDMQEAGPVERRVRARLERFLHPLTGGPDGSGWPFGRDVYLSDLASILEAVDGVDYVQELQLLRNGSPQGERAIVPPDRVVAAGPIRIRVRATESIGR